MPVSWARERGGGARRRQRHRRLESVGGAVDEVAGGLQRAGGVGAAADEHVVAGSDAVWPSRGTESAAGSAVTVAGGMVGVMTSRSPARRCGLAAEDEHVAVGERRRGGADAIGCAPTS